MKIGTRQLAFLWTGLLFAIVIELEPSEILASLKEVQSNPRTAEIERFAKKAFILHQQRRYEEAILAASRALELSRAAFGQSDFRTTPSIQNLARILLQVGRASEAKELLIRSLEIETEALSPHHPAVAETLMELGELHQHTGDLREAESYLTRALAVFEAAENPAGQATALSLHALGWLRYEQGFYAQGVVEVQRAIDILETVFASGHLATASPKNTLGLLLQRLGRFDEARSPLEQSLRIRERYLPKDHLDIAQSCNSLGWLLKDMGHFDLAGDYLNRSWKIIDKVVEEHHPIRVTVLSNRADLSATSGDLASARAYLERALAILGKISRVENPQSALIRNNLGTVLMRQGNLDEAQTHLESALRTRQSVLDPDHPDIAQSQSNLGSLLEKRGEWSQAKQYHDRALRICEKRLGRNHVLTAVPLTNLGVLLMELGDLEGASLHLGRALDIRSEVLPANHPDWIVSVNNYGTILVSLERLEDARALFERALTELSGKTHPYEATVLNNLGWVTTSLGELERAESYFERALAIAQNSKPSSLASIWNNWGLLALRKGRLEESRKHTAQALDLRMRYFGLGHPSIASSLKNLSLLHRMSNDLESAIRVLGETLKAEERSFSLVLQLLSPRRRMLLQKQAQSTSYIALSYLKEAIKGNSKQTPKALDVALSAVLNWKGRSISTARRQSEQFREHSGSDHDKELRQLLLLRARIARLFLEESWNWSNDKLREILRLRNEVDEIEEDLVARGVSLSDADLIAPREMRSAIPKDTIFLEFFKYLPLRLSGLPDKSWGRPRYSVFVISRSRPARWVDLGEAEEVENVVGRMRRAITQVHHPSVVREKAERLYAQTIGKALPHFDDIDNLIVSPDGALNLIPFEALINEKGQYLVEVVNVGYSTSSRTFLEKRSSAIAGEGLLVGGVNFDADLPAAKGTSPGLEQWDGLRSFGSLDNSLVEVKAIKPLLKNVKDLHGSEATEKAVKETSRPWILHIATHGFYLPGPKHPQAPPIQSDRATSLALRMDEPLLRSGLALAGANKGRQADFANDGLLTSMEMAELNLWGTAMVVLSACGTGLGDVEDGDGVFGLRRSLVAAGSRTQVMSLWNVSDYATQKFMVSFYKLLNEGLSRGKALRQVQLAMLQGVLKPSLEERRWLRDRAKPVPHPPYLPTDYRHPVFWASFILSGDRGPIIR